MKKHNLFLSLCTILLSFFMIACNTVEDTEKTLKIENTDITAYINGIVISSYNINGYISIAAEDLEKYGFNIDYSEWLRQLVVKYNETKEITADYVPQKTSKTIGSFFANIYQTDIITRFEGQKILS